MRRGGAAAVSDVASVAAVARCCFVADASLPSIYRPSVVLSTRRRTGCYQKTATGDAAMDNSVHAILVGGGRSLVTTGCH